MHGPSARALIPATLSRGGFSLIELMLAVGVIAIVLATVTAAIGFLETSRIQGTVQDVGTLQKAAARWLERGRLDYSTVTVSALKTDGEMPSTWGATNPYGGTYTVGPATGDATHLTVTVSGLSTTVGTTLVSYYTGRAQSVSLSAGTLTITF